MVEEFKNENGATKWYLAYSEENQVYHYGEVPADHEVITGQPYLEILTSEAALSARLAALTGDPDYYNNNKPNVGDIS